MATTPVFFWRYQSLTDPPNGATLGGDLALDIEATVANHEARLDTIEAAGRGFIVESVRTTPVGPFTTETAIQAATWTATSDRRYKVTAVQGVHSTVSGDLVQMRLRWKLGPTMDIASTEMHSIIVTCITANLAIEQDMIRTVTGLSGQVTVGVTAVRFSGTGNITMHGDGSQNQILLVEAV